MRRAFYILIAVSTFSMGVYFNTLKYPIKNLSLCEIKQNAHLYDKQEVRAKGYIEVTQLQENEDDDYFDFLSTFDDDCPAAANLVYAENLKRDESLRKLREETRLANKAIRKSGSLEGWYVAEVEVVAEVDDLSDDGITHCFTPDLSLKVKEIKQISPIRFISNQETLK